MKSQVFRQLILSFCLLTTMPKLTAQPHGQKDCSVVQLTGHEAELYERICQHRLVSLPRRQAGRTSSPTSVIHNSGEVYTFRLALCITPEVLSEFANGDPAAVEAWWDRMEDFLNSCYRQDVGIRFTLVRDNRLIMQAEVPDHPVRVNGRPATTDATNIIDALIGNDAYDLGLLIMQTSGGLAGQATLGGAAFPTQKGSGWASNRTATIAHELGHLLGASHTHQTEDGDCTEPGSGQSIMSYGHPRTHFSLSSIRAMRNLMKALNVYTAANRSPESADTSRNPETTNMPCVLPEEGIPPLLDRDLLQQEYIVTAGSSFQFYLPLLTPGSDSLHYAAHGFDISLLQGSNALQPVYPSSASSCLMFQPYYASPLELAEDALSEYVPFSDASRPGLFTFLAAVRNQSLYDSEPIRLQIVPGTPFQAHITSPSNFSLFRWGRALTVQWTPLTEVYGSDSRVRILLSTDFGQTFPYLLADDLPNTGEWTGALPYLPIGRTTYRDLPQSIGGGAIKVELKGEAIYDAVPKIPYYRTGNEYIYTGGFTLDESSARVLFTPAPEPFVTLDSLEELPPLPVLQAYNKSNPGTLYPTTAAEEAEGCLVRRTWKAVVSGTEYVYTQVFRLPEAKPENASLLKQARDAAALATDLIHHEGQPGYPLPSTEAFAQLKAVYPRVFDGEGRLCSGATDEDIEAVLTALSAINQLNDDAIVWPDGGKAYLLRSYQALPATTPYYYCHRDADGTEYFTTDSLTATVLQCERGIDCLYLTDEEGHTPWLDGMTNTQPDFLLHRGYTWGAFTLLNRHLSQAMLSRNGQTFSLNHHYREAPEGYRCNNNGGTIVSSDFQFVPVAGDTPPVTGVTLPAGTAATDADAPQTVYDLSGRRTAIGASGVYIIGRRKVMVR